MPRYLYRCDLCGAHIEINHSITKKYEICSEISEEECDGSLTRIPSFSRYIKTARKTDDKPVGKITQEAIAAAATELKEQKRELKKKQEYNEHND